MVLVTVLAQDNLASYTYCGMYSLFSLRLVSLRPFDSCLSLLWQIADLLIKHNNM